MKSITLEFSKLQILKGRERWRLYFIMVAEHPADNDKMIVSTFPDPYIRLKPNKENVISFEPEGSPGVDGMFVIERELPADNRIKARVYLRQSRKTTRNVGRCTIRSSKDTGRRCFRDCNRYYGIGCTMACCGQKGITHDW